MALPIRTTIDDIRAICKYLEKKPTGVTLSQAKTVLDSKYLDPRKINALKYWKLLEDQEKLRLTEIGRELIKNNGAYEVSILSDVICEVRPYHAIIERAAHNEEDSITAADVGAHWHTHFASDCSESDKILNDQAVCFFQIAQGANLGQIIMGRGGSPTRLEFNKANLKSFIDEMPESGIKELGDEFFEENEATLRKEKLPPNNISSKTLQQGQGIFIAHGKNDVPLKDLKSILDQFRIPYKVAEDEPNLGRPIGMKVKETMQSCNCAILIFTPDEEFQDKRGNTVWRPSENVVYELGAASFLYENRIVILKEESVNFPSNFKDLGYISFNKDQLKAKSMDVLKELIGFGIVKVST